MSGSPPGEGGPPNDQDDVELLTMAEVENWLRVSRTTVMGLIKNGAFPAYSLGGRRAYRIPKDAVAAWLETTRVVPGTITWVADADDEPDEDE